MVTTTTAHIHNSRCVISIHNQYYCVTLLLLLATYLIFSMLNAQFSHLEVRNSP